MATQKPRSPDSFYIWAQSFDVIKRVITALLYGWLAYMAYKSIDALAGRVTRADIDIALAYFTSKENDYGLPWVVAVVCFIWAVGERKLRYRKTEGMAEEIRQLQLKLDPNRTTSGLLRTGQTNPKDRLT